MHRRDFLTGGLGLAAGAIAIRGLAAEAAEKSFRVTSRFVPTGTMRDSLTRSAAEITSACRKRLATRRASEWRKEGPALRAQWRRLLGIDQVWRPDRQPPAVQVTGRIERPGYCIEKLAYEAWPGLFITANLYLPKRVEGRLPAILYVSGHAREPKAHYQAHARKFAELGFVCLITDTVQLGEIPGYHHGPYREGWWHWYSRGYTPAGIETWCAIRALDLLAQRPEVDADRLGMTGISGGGVTTWWTAAADERVRVAAPVCGTATLFSQIHDRTIDGHCDCIWWINTAQWDLGDVGALVAPRPLLIASADRDGIFTIESIREVHAQVASVYRKFRAAEHLRLVETPGGHSYHERSRTEIFAWFARHLQGRSSSPEQVGDLELDPSRLEKPADLRVFAGAPPADACNARVQDLFPKLAQPPEIVDAAALRTERKRVVEALRRETFAAFPTRPRDLDLQIEHAFDESMTGFRFGFTSEEGWRLHGQRMSRKPIPSRAPALVALRYPGEASGETRDFLGRLQAPWVRVEVEVRGTGESSWGRDQMWHLRRAAAWTGRTIASMRVWDALRAVEAVRKLPGVDPRRISIAGRGEMAAIALYAALLDGDLKAVVLQDPPATQDVPGEKDGTGPALEMLGCLRVTDLAPISGLLWPSELVLVGTIPESYRVAETIRGAMALGGRAVRCADLRDWAPA